MSLIIQVSELSFSNSDGIRILEDVHLRIDREEMAFIIGPTGAGKSVLLGLLAALIPPQTGQILVHGRNVARLSRRKILELRQRIGFLPQGFTPLPKTVLENVAFKLRTLGDFREKAEEKGLAALEKVGLTVKLASQARELEPLETLELGFAVAICNEPLLVLLDEPFAPLEPAEQTEMFSILQHVHADGATVLAATRGPLPPGAEAYRTIELSNGKVTAR